MVIPGKIKGTKNKDFKKFLAGKWYLPNIHAKGKPNNSVKIAL
jgi:hypothetical protein